MSIITGRTLTIGSHHRTSTTDSFSDFEVNLYSASIVDTSADIVVRYVSIPFTVYNVNANTQALTFEEDDNSGFSSPTAFNLTLTVKDYTGSQLASHVETLMNAEAANNTYAVAYDSQTAKFTFTGSVGTDFFRFKFNNTTHKSSPCRLLGFTAPLHSTSGASVDANTSGGEAQTSTLVSDKLAELQPLDSIQLRVQGFFDGQSSSGLTSDHDILLSIQAQVPFGHILNYTPSDSNESYHIRQLFSHKRFRLTTDFRNGSGSVTLPLNSDWEMFCAVRQHRGNSLPKEPRVDILSQKPNSSF